MYLRKKINPSGVISVQVIDKSTGRYKMIQSIGSSSDAKELAKLVLEGEKWIKSRIGQLEFDFTDEKRIAEQFLDNIEQITVHGTELLLGQIFDQIGFNNIPDLLFRQLVIARLSFPVSKLKTTDFLSKYQFFSIADSGLLSRENLSELNQKGYEYILGARIKSETKTIKERITSLQLRDGQSEVIEKTDGTRLVVSYSTKRAAKDKHNRERGLQKLEKKIRTGKLTKANINNRGYNKYLKLEGEITVEIDLDKFHLDAQWDGLKGYTTNTHLTKEQIIENYGQLWKIEKAFRVSKHDLRIRPIFHRVKRRIESHICIAFVAYKVYKELERQLREKHSSLSPEKAIEIAKTIYSVRIKTPTQKHILSKIILMTKEQKYLANLFGF